MIKNGAEINIGPATLNYNDLPAELTFTIASKSEQLPDRSAFSLENPLMLIGLIKADLDLNVHKDLAAMLAVPQLKAQLAAGVPPGEQIDEAQLERMAQAQAPAMLGGFVQQGFAREEGDRYILKAGYDNGSMTINGNPFPLGALLGQ